MKRHCLTVTRTSQVGIIAAIAGCLARHNDNITDSAQYEDKSTSAFFMRISFEIGQDAELAPLEEDSAQVAADWGPTMPSTMRRARCALSSWCPASDTA